MTFPPEYRWLLTQGNGVVLSSDLIPYIEMEDEEEIDEDDFDLGCKKHMGQPLGFDHTRQALSMTWPDLFARLAEVAKQPKPPVDRLAGAVAARDLDGVKAALAEDRKMPWGTRDGRIPLRMMFEAKYVDALRAYVESSDDLNPKGEKAAGMIDLLQQAQEGMGGLMGKMQEKLAQQRDEGFVGAPANAQRHYSDPEAAARAIPILEAYGRAKRG